MFWVYILENPQGRFYIGHTDSLPDRLHSHNRTDRTLGKFTRKNGPWELAQLRGFEGGEPRKWLPTNGRTG